ncbi:putative L-lactate dehydrogenase [Megasphaera hutchinsoni]|uniref:Putative L-lactate dehydrogenase n=2 Tax=Megasphaera TaxID=906 RepID=A0A134CFE3_9FIRM|nr:putative L-lactate dehydrogenase [Megasphaera hutchinsoni]
MEEIIMGLKKRIVGVVGLGHVGAHVAFNLGMMGIADAVYLCDKNEQKVLSEVQDLNDAAPFMPNHTVYTVVDYAGLKDCDIIVNAVGNIALLATHDRDKELENSVKEVADFIPKIMAAGFDGIFVNITNPCDVITNLIREKSGLPTQRVVGTGTLLDSARLIAVISKHTGLDARGFTAFMIGEHGNAQMAAWSCISFYGKPLRELTNKKEFQFTKEESQAMAIKGAWVTYVGKQCTEYGVASAGATLVRTILRDEKRIIPVSAYLNGEYGEKGIYCGIPAIISAKGVESIIEYELTDEEKVEFKQCCDAIRKNIEKSHALL